MLSSPEDIFFCFVPNFSLFCGPVSFPFESFSLPTMVKKSVKEARRRQVKAARKAKKNTSKRTPTKAENAKVRQAGGYAALRKRKVEDRRRRRAGPAGSTRGGPRSRHDTPPPEPPLRMITAARLGRLPLDTDSVLGLVELLADDLVDHPRRAGTATALETATGSVLGNTGTTKSQRAELRARALSTAVRTYADCLLRYGFGPEVVRFVLSQVSPPKPREMRYFLQLTQPWVVWLERDFARRGGDEDDDPSACDRLRASLRIQESLLGNDPYLCRLLDWCSLHLRDVVLPQAFGRLPPRLLFRLDRAPSSGPVDSTESGNSEWGLVPLRTASLVPPAAGA